MKDIWMYLLPSGFIASLLTWLVNRRRERLKDIKEEHTVYRELYEDLRELIRKQGIEHGKLRRKIYQMERCFEEIGRCSRRNYCPVRRQLSLLEDDSTVSSVRKGGADRARGDPVA
ncbi:MAG: hypothetical protein ACRCX4_11990 [Bacteroidales bacterium]